MVNMLDDFFIINDNLIAQDRARIAVLIKEFKNTNDYLFGLINYFSQNRLVYVF